MAKNSLIHLALPESVREGIKPYLVQTTSVALDFEDGIDLRHGVALRVAVAGLGEARVDGRRQPRVSVGVEREIINGLSLGADVVRTQNRDQVLSANLNPLGGADPSNGGGGSRPDTGPDVRHRESTDRC